MSRNTRGRRYCKQCRKRKGEGSFLKTSEICRSCRTEKGPEVRHENILRHVLMEKDDTGFEPISDRHFQPTNARAGSVEKIQILAERVESGYPLFHPHDNQLVSYQPERRGVCLDSIGGLS